MTRPVPRRFTEYANQAPSCRLAARLVYFAMISDREIWQAAAMVKRYGDDAAREAEFRADELLVEGDAEGYAIWRRIMSAVEGLSATEPGGRVN